MRSSFRRASSSMWAKCSWMMPSIFDCTPSSSSIVVWHSVVVVGAVTPCSFLSPRTVMLIEMAELFEYNKDASWLMKHHPERWLEWYKVPYSSMKTYREYVVLYITRSRIRFLSMCVSNIAQWYTRFKNNNFRVCYEHTVWHHSFDTHAHTDQHNNNILERILEYFRDEISYWIWCGICAKCKLASTAFSLILQNR